MRLLNVMFMGCFISAVSCAGNGTASTFNPYSQETVDGLYKALVAKNNACSPGDTCQFAKRTPKCPCPYLCSPPAINEANSAAFVAEFDATPALTYDSCKNNCPIAACAANVTAACASTGKCTTNY